MNRNSFRTLEFDAVRALLLQHSRFPRGRARLEGLAPFTDTASVREAQRTTSEARRLLETAGRQPYGDLPDPEPLMAACHAEGAVLEPEALLQVAAFAEGAVEIGRSVARAEGAPFLSRRASEIRDLSGLAAEIRRVVLPGGQVADNASPRLADLRRQLARLRSSLHAVMDAYLHDPTQERVLQDRVVTTRNERYVLLVKAEQRAQLPGIVHGSSGSGASLFVEPMPAVELNNDIVASSEEEQREILRLLGALSARVREAAAPLGQAAEILGELDAAQARGLLAQDMKATAPDILDAQAPFELELKEARHPLLSAALCERLGRERQSEREPVPVTLRLDSQAPVLVISGPNTGGKTVALKTLGLLSLMAQSGLHVPAAAGSRLPVFRRVFADIGDDQSISANLSTFSAHLAQLVAMTRELELPALVLLDEVGAGTDPEEGGALGVAVVEHFRARGAAVAATTHHGLMKAYAEATPGVACASFGYDPSDYEPTYRLSVGSAGRSLALEMAERLGLPPELLADARARLDTKRVQLDALLRKLEEDRTALDAEAQQLARDRRELEARSAGLAASEEDAERKRRSRAESFAGELKKLEANLRQRLDAALQAAVQRVERSRAAAAPARTAARARSAALSEARAHIEQVLATPELDLAPRREPAATALAAGERVRVGEIGVVGEVLALHRDSVELAVSGKRLNVPRESVHRVAGPHASAPHALRGQPAPREAPGEINLVGQTVDEALPRVDKLLDDAVLAERSELRVVHGFGQGRLRSAVAELLKEHPHVASFRPGGPGEGGGGVTVVTLNTE